MKIKILCPNCGSKLEIMWVIGADESLSGCTERLGHCPNENCDCDWKILHDSTGLKDTFLDKEKNNI